MKAEKIYITILLAIGVALLLNLVANEFFVRFDLTQNGQYTLSAATKKILKELDEPITVKAYFSENMPPDIARTKKDFRELLVEYSNRSGGNLVYEFVNPNEDEASETEAMQNGIQPVLINVREKDQMKQQKAFLGAVIQKGEQKDVIPFMQPGGAMEYALTTSIKKISVVDKPSVGFLQGHGEPSLSAMTQAYSALSILYSVEEVNLSESPEIPANMKTLAIVAPKDSLSPEVFAALDEFMGRGGKILVAINRVEGDFSTAQGKAVDTGLELWLRRKGIEVQPNFLVDVNCGAVTVQQQQGGFVFNNQVSFPYLPIISQFAEHPAVQGLESVIFKFASPINFFGDTGTRFTPLLFSSVKSGVQPSPTFFDINKRWEDGDFPASNLVIAGAAEGTWGGPYPTRLLVIGDGDFAVNGERNQAQQLQPDNVNLLVNSIDWLSDDTGLIDLRTKTVTSRPLDTLEDDTKTLLKYLNFLAPILLAIGYGVVRAQSRKRKRMERMIDNW